MTDWVKTLKEAGRIAQETEADALKLIVSDTLSMEHALRLLDAIENLADDFVEVTDALRMDEAVDDGLLEAAEEIEDFWSSLALRCLNKVRSLQNTELP